MSTKTVKFKKQSEKGAEAPSSANSNEGFPYFSSTSHNQREWGGERRRRGGDGSGGVTLVRTPAWRCLHQPDTATVKTEREEEMERARERGAAAMAVTRVLVGSSPAPMEGHAGQGFKS